jgi:hypothetical protein
MQNNYMSVKFKLIHYSINYLYISFICTWIRVVATLMSQYAH